MISQFRVQLEGGFELVWISTFFGRTAVQNHPQVSSDVFEAHFDYKPSNSAAGLVPDSRLLDVVLECYSENAGPEVNVPLGSKPVASTNTTAVYLSPKYHP
jgi:hypothetical protein